MIYFEDGLTNNKLKFIGLRLKFFFIFLNFVLENSKNIHYNKDVINIIFSSYKINKINIQGILSKTNSSEDFYFT